MLGILAILIIAFMVSGCDTPEDGSYSVLYQANGCTSGFPPVDNNKYKTGTEATVLGSNDLKKEGYDFKNWNTKSNGEGTPYNIGSKIKIEHQTVFLYAVWEAKGS
jgi:hypothetical protein